jgi:signal transduction histidine kinase
VKAARSRVVVSVVGETTPAEGVRVSVRDDGPGLPTGVKEQLAPTGGSSSPWGGRSGLGLRLCVEIAQAIGTRLEVGEAAGGGAEISFTLPRAKS